VQRDAAARSVVLNDSAATLRQIRTALADFGDASEADSELESVMSRVKGNGPGLGEVVRMLAATYAGIMDVIESLRRSRGLLEVASMERLKSTGLKLAEVSSATETAATGMLDGLDRALSLVDRLDQAARSPEAGGEVTGAAVRGDLRNELHQVMGLLQFQDITSQQLGYAASVLAEVEEKMLRLSRIFDPTEEVAAPAPPTSTTCDPNATTLGAEERQAVADSIFTSPAGR
jgi:chemotaxis regulatin CheY-phosphate phosphatase CheZ